MIKKNKGKLLISSLVILLPILAGLILWNDLPDSMIIHWGADGHADGSGSRAFAVFGLPLFLLALHGICLFLFAKDPKNREQNKKATNLVFWITPIISLFSSGVIYSAAMGKGIGLKAFPLVTTGLLFILIGNYLPKTRQNHTLGIRVPWTLNDEENWNRTHRLGGKLMVAGGLICLFAVFLPQEAAMPVILLVTLLLACIVPVIYSYCFYRRQIKAGPYAAPGQQTPKPLSTGAKILSVILVIFFFAIAALLFTGSIHTECGDSSLTIKASYWGDLEVDYAAIDSIEYRESCPAGTRTYGFGSPRLSMGNFQNQEFGVYTRYTYTGSAPCILLRVGEKILVIGDKDEESTQALYALLSSKIQ